MLTTRLRVAALLAVLSCAAPAHAAGTPEPAPGQERLEMLPPVIGVTERWTSHGLSGLALDGFDPVSYFLGSSPVPGRPDVEVLWGGVAWRFASAANRAAFLRDPLTYAPRLGGHDTAGLREGAIADADPALYVIRPKGLYLFRDEAARRAFLADETLFEAAEQGWTAVQREIVTR